MPKMFRSAALLVALTLGAGTMAEAGPITLRLTTSGGATTTVVGAANLVTFTGAIGSYTLALVAGSSNNPGGANATLDISTLSIQKTATNNETLTIELSQTDFLLPAGPTLTLDSAASATFNNPNNVDSVTFQSFLNDPNVLFGTGGTSGLLALNSGTCAPLPGCNTSTNANAAAVNVVGSAPYALTSVTFINLSNGDPSRSVSTTGNTIVSSVPQTVPDGGSTAALLGSVLVGFGILRRKISNI